MSFYSPIDRLAQNLPRPKGTGSEFMTELSKMPGYKAQEAEDRGLQALMNLPKMERADFIAKLKAHRGPPVEENTFAKSILRNPGLNVVPNEDPHHEHWTLPGGTNYREILLKHGDPKEEFPGEPAHFGGEPNILASIRAKDRVGPNGEKILHLEEIQSDWHQQGREKGYLNPKEEHTAEEKKYGVPDAPFKKSWHEMALKKMIHHAAANGYDSIAITPGAEQADRYGLAKHIGMMSYNPEDQHFQAFKPNRETAISERGATPERVSELVGKELAQKLMAAPKQMGHHYIEGDDMKVGGEGMKGFYDKIVPNFLNQFGKKYGAKVGRVKIPGDPSQRGDASEALGLAGTRFADMTPEQITAFNQKLDDHNAKTLHHFPITPAMREDVTKNGVPLYADGGPVPPLRPLNPQLAAAREQMAAQSALHKAYDEAMKNVYTNQMPTFAQWVASQGKAKGGSVGYPMAPKGEWYGEGTYEQEGGKLKNVSPAAYLAKVRPLTMDAESRENIDLLKKHIQSGKTLDPLLIRASGIEDGRHRAHAAKELGIKTVPVIDYGNHFAKGGSIKPVGYTKEQVTVSPNLDAMRYELESVKHYTKKVK